LALQRDELKSASGSDDEFIKVCEILRDTRRIKMTAQELRFCRPQSSWILASFSHVQNLAFARADSLASLF